VVRFQSFQTRVVALFVGLVTVVQLVGFVVVSLAITRNARAQIREELAVGAKVFGRLITARGPGTWPRRPGSCPETSRSRRPYRPRTAPPFFRRWRITRRGSAPMR